MADYAIHDTTLIAQANILRKKFGTNDRQDPADYAYKMNLMGLLEEKTQASASVCSFEDGADDVPLKKCEITVPASLDGYSSVDVKHCGKNLLPMVNYDGGVYNPDIGRQLNLTVSETQFTKNGNVYSVTTSVSWKTFTVLFPLISGVTYYEKWTLSIESGQQGSTRAYLDEDFKVLARYNSNSSDPIVTNGVMTPPTGTKYLAITWTNRGTVVQTLNITEPMIEIGSSASAWEEYNGTTHTASLGRTIYGGQADIVNGVGQETEKGKWLSELSWTQNATYPHVFNGAGFTDRKKSINWNNATCLSDRYTGYTSSEVGTKSEGIALGTGATNTTIYVSDDRFETVAEFTASLETDDSFVVLPLETPTDFTFTGQEVPTRLGYNAFWNDDGDTEVTYRSSGTITSVLPTLISKTITENDTYLAEDDNADGYSEVIVNVSGGGTIIVDDLIEYPYPNNDNKCIYSSELSSQYAYYAFNPDCGNPYYWTGIGATNQYVGWKFDTAQIVNYYEIWSRNVGNVYDYLQAPKQWKLQGSNDDGSTWTDLDTQDFTFTAGGQKWAGAVNNTTAYKWYRVFVITAQDTANDTVIGYIDFKHAYIE